jgi:hypothetical protein
LDKNDKVSMIFKVPLNPCPAVVTFVQFHTCTRAGPCFAVTSLQVHSRQPVSQLFGR